MRIYKQQLQPFKNHQGFTLIEILITMTVLAIGLLGLASMQISAMRSNSLASELTEAATIAQAKIEELALIPYDDSQLTDTTGEGASDHEDTNPPDGYTVIWSVTDDNPMPANKLITVTATRSIDNKKVQLTYIKAAVTQ